MSFVTKMKCSYCGAGYPSKEKVCMCINGDNGRLDIYYDYDGLTKKINRKTLSGRIPNVWKYYELFQVNSRKNIVSINEGGIPLLKAHNLAKKLHLRTLYLKDETRNPTGSFKDRSMTVGISKALEFDAKTVATASQNLSPYHF